MMSLNTLVPIFGGRYPVSDIQFLADRMEGGLAIRHDAVIRITLTHFLVSINVFANIQDYAWQMNN